MDRVVELAEAMFVPAISGAAISAHRLNSERFSVADSEPLPTSSMSGSFQWPGPGVRGQAHVAVEDRQHAGEAGVDVAGGAPAVADARAPGPHVLLAPVAQAVQDRPAGRGQGVAHGGVAGLRGHTVVVAVVVLQVVHAPRGERLGVGGLMAEAAGVPGTGRGARVLVDAQLQAEGVHIVRGALDAVGELGGVRNQPAGGVTGVRHPAVVDVDVGVARSLHAVGVHGLRGGLDQRLGDVAAVGVPVVEAHLRGQRQAVAQRRGGWGRAQGHQREAEGQEERGEDQREHSRGGHCLNGSALPPW